MIILFLLFIAIPMVLAIAVTVGLIVAFTNFVVEAQTKRLSKGGAINEAAIREKTLAQIAWTCVGCLAAFILFLVLRYYTT